MVITRGEEEQEEDEEDELIFYKSIHTIAYWYITYYRKEIKKKIFKPSKRPIKQGFLRKKKKKQQAKNNEWREDHLNILL